MVLLYFIYSFCFAARFAVQCLGTAKLGKYDPPPWQQVFHWESHKRSQSRPADEQTKWQSKIISRQVLWQVLIKASKKGREGKTYAGRWAFHETPAKRRPTAVVEARQQKTVLRADDSSNDKSDNISVRCESSRRKIFHSDVICYPFPTNRLFTSLRVTPWHPSMFFSVLLLCNPAESQLAFSC